MKGLACLVASREDELTRTLELELGDIYGRVTVVEELDACPPCALALVDIDHTHGVVVGPSAERVIAYGREMRTSACTYLARPFRMATLRSLFTGNGEGAVLRPADDFRTVTVGDETVSLSEREAAVLRLLYLADGAPVDRHTLAREVFPEAEAPEDAVNVYIHYLRKKLERNGTRRIRAHRGGYSLSIG